MAQAGLGILPSVMKPMAAPKPPQPIRPPFFERSEARAIGGLHSPVAGRTDHLPIKVPSGSYVMPADVVSGLGQGNTQAGMHVLDHMFNSGPYGVAPMKGSPGGLSPAHLSFPKMKYADGGAVPILAAGGEYVIPPEHVAAIGDGDINTGHDILDQFVKNTRQKTITDMRNLPGPAK